LRSGPRRDALKTPTSRPTTHRSTLACVFTRDGRHDLPGPLWTPCRMHTHSGATPTGNTTLPAARSTSSERSRLRTDTPLNPNACASPSGRPHHERAQTTPDSGEIRTSHGTRPPTHLLSTNPIDAAFSPNRPILSAMGRRISRLPPPTAAAQRRAVRALMSQCTATGSGTT
jgi:hypothetical protein